MTDDLQWNPMGEARWTLAMALSWIMRRSADEVRARWGDYQAQVLDLDTLDTPWTVYHYEGRMLCHDGEGGMREAFALEPDRAKRELESALRSSAIVATGLAVPGGDRAPIPSEQWEDLDLIAIRPGPKNYADAAYVRDDSKPRFYAVRVDRKTVLKIWPPSAGVSLGSAADERACYRFLLALMRAQQNDPRSKDAVRAEHFPSAPKRMFDRAWTDAARDAPAPAWTKPGPRKSSQP